MTSLAVLKVGGSLFDLPDLRERLRDWLARQPESHLLIVSGGGLMADAIRAYHKSQPLGEVQSHWLAIRTMTLNAYLLQALIPEAAVVDAPREGGPRVCLLDAFAFLDRDERCPAALPHSWMVTSDSIALRAAKVFEADRLVLVKSTDLPPGTTWADASAMGLVDAWFPQIAGDVIIDWVNLRRTGERHDSDQ